MAVDQDFDEEDEEDEMEVDLRPKRGNIVISEEELHGWPARRIKVRSMRVLEEVRKEMKKRSGSL